MKDMLVRCLKMVSSHLAHSHICSVAHSNLSERVSQSAQILQTPAPISVVDFSQNFALGSGRLAYSFFVVAISNCQGIFNVRNNAHGLSVTPPRAQDVLSHHLELRSFCHTTQKPGFLPHHLELMTICHTTRTFCNATWRKGCSVTPPEEKDVLLRHLETGTFCRATWRPGRSATPPGDQDVLSCHLEHRTFCQAIWSSGRSTMLPGAQDVVSRYLELRKLCYTTQKLGCSVTLPRNQTTNRNGKSYFL